MPERRTEASAGRGRWREGSLYPDAFASPGQALKRPYSRGRFAANRAIVRA